MDMDLDNNDPNLHNPQVILGTSRQLSDWLVCFTKRGQGYGPGYGQSRTDLKSTLPPPVTKTTLKTTSPPKTLGEYFLCLQSLQFSEKAFKYIVYIQVYSLIFQTEWEIFILNFPHVHSLSSIKLFSVAGEQTIKALLQFGIVVGVCLMVGLGFTTMVGVEILCDKFVDEYR